MFDPLLRTTHTSFARTERLEGKDVLFERVHDLAAVVIRTRQVPKGWPGRVGEIASVAGVASWCTRPGGWLTILPQTQAAAWCAAIGKRLAGTTHQCLDLSGGFLTVDVSGPAAAAFLAHGMTIRLLDLSEHRGARTSCAGLAVFIRARAEGGFRIHIDTSLADPFWRWVAETLP